MNVMLSISTTKTAARAHVLAIALSITTTLTLSACMSTEELYNNDPDASTSAIETTPTPTSPSPTPTPDPPAGYNGCVTGTALDTASIYVTFEFPAVASKAEVYRDGVLAFSTTNPVVTDFTNTNLNQGQTYLYTCAITVNGYSYMGPTTLTVATISIDAPTFGGVTTSTALSSSSVRVNWNPASATGVRAASYKVYGNPGTSVNWALAPKATATAGTLNATITGLGDELTYAFGVRACSEAANCDTNTATTTKTLADGGAPTTSGATAISMSNGTGVITAPWSDAQGAVYKRKVYRSTTGGTDINNYSLVQTVIISDLTAPSTSINITGLAESTQYYFIIRDEDPTGNLNSNTNVVSINTGDMTAPSFSGLTGLAWGTPASTVLTATWTAITSQPGDSNGASQYLIYATTAQLPSVPTDPCAASGPTLLTQVAATSYTAGNTVNYDITGLTPRTSYKICVKARDSAGNISTTVATGAKVTKDVTAPDFDGIQTLSFNNAQSRMDVTWNPSTASDILEYRIKIWKNTATPNPGDITTITRSHASYSSGFNFTASDFIFITSDVVYVLVDACDNASPNYGTQNCTASATNTAKYVTVPDTTPPANFLGIAGSGSQGTPAEGQVSVAWNAPSDWSDYRGFFIYLVDTANGNALTFTKDCACSANNCPDHLTTCTVIGLDAYRTYYFHVRAYDAAGNITTNLDPGVSRASKRTTDTTVPTFASNLTIGFSGGVTLSWDVATDNQYATEAGVLNYKIYRKQGSTFASATNPAADGTLLATQTARTYLDASGGLTQGQTNYYAVCAVDVSLNFGCDGNIKSKLIPDVTNPTISAISTTKTPANKTWNLSWTPTDNVTSSGLLLVRVYKKVATSAADMPTTSDELYTSGLGLSAINGETNTAETTGLNRFVNYLITVQDEAGNTTQGTKAIYIKNTNPTAPVITSPGAGATVNTLQQTYTGTCLSTTDTNATPPTAPTTTATGGTGVTILSYSCVAGVLNVSALFQGQVASPAITVTTDDNQGQTSTSITHTITNNFICPTNYVGVPGSATTGVPDFCIARYIMSNNSGVAASRPDLLPWSGVSLPTAITNCAALGTGYSLISNAQWQTMARNIENVASNWSGGSIGNGGIPRGHSDNSPSSIIAAAATNAAPAVVDANPYYLTGNSSADAYGSGWEQKRFLTLSNGENVWDTTGNNVQLVSDSIPLAIVAPYIKDGWNTTHEYTDTVYFNNNERSLFAPANPAYTSTNGMGTILYVDRNTGAYLKRGSGYNAGTSGGIFSSTYYASSNNGSFRCVYQPANTSALHISYPPLNSSIKGITTAYTGKCNSTAGNTTTVTPGAGVTVTVAPTCTNSVLTFTTTYTPETAPGTQSVTITTRDSGSNIIDQITHSVTNNFYCPTNYVFVPGNDGQGTTDFCVAKYEMKALNSGSLITDGNVAYSAAYVAASRPDGTPWVNISQTNAITECSAASLGTGYSLISNAQWQTIARNIESVNSNWSGGVVGSGGISRGNSDGAISATAVADGFAFAGTNLLMAYTSNAAASTVDTDPYRGTGNSSAQAYLSGKEQSRYHTLTTNEKIWDIGGNGSEWVSDLMSGASLTPTISTSEWYEYTNTTYLPASPTTNRTLFGPANTGYNSDNGMGKIYGGSGGAVARSGHCWTDGAGVFSAHLGLAPSDVSFIIGFRCVFVP